MWKRRGCQDNGFGKIARSINKGMITRAQRLCWFTVLFNKQLKQTSLTYQPRQNKQEIVLPEVCIKSFRWPSFFCITKLSVNRVTKSGVSHIPFLSSKPVTWNVAATKGQYIWIVLARCHFWWTQMDSNTYMNIWLSGASG
jgi:hypothetical protein